MEKCYIIKGCNGDEYEPRIWLVGVFMSYEQAKSFCDRLNCAISEFYDLEVDIINNYEQYKENNRLSFSDFLRKNGHLEQLEKLDQDISNYSYNYNFFRISYSVWESKLFSCEA